MSDEQPPQVTSEELNQWLSRDRKKQRLVAERIFVSERTIDGWRHGGKIPPQYHQVLRQMMDGEDSLLLMLPPETIARIANQAQLKGFKSKEAFLSELLKGFMAVALLFSIGNQIMHPEDGMARRFGGRRKQEGSGAFVVDCDAEA